MRRTLLLLTLVGCSEYDITEKSNVLTDNDDGTAPDILVDPMLVDFGAVDVQEAVNPTQLITITNEGDATLELSSVVIDGDVAFTMSAISAVAVPPGQSTTFTVTFAPESALTYTADVVINSNDPDEAQTLVELTGSGLAPMIEVTPTVYDFGTLYIGCEQQVPITIKNVGTADLEITDINYTSYAPDLSVEDISATEPFPWIIAPEGTKDVYVTYNPLDDQDDEGFLSVFSNDPVQSEAKVTQTGAGTLYGNGLDVFEQPIQGRTDIIFTLDWSGSMSDDIARVQENFSVFISSLQSLDNDYQISAVVDDDGCVNGSDVFLDSTMDESDQQSIFDTMIQQSGGAMYTEMGFTLLEAATTSAALSGCNSGMIRDDAALAMVGVTDEPEQSPNLWSVYVSLFQSLKRDADDLVMHAVAGDYPSGCGGNEPGTGWYEATVATGGLFLSICAEDWAGHLQALAEGSSQDLSSFELTDEPVEQTIVVRIDGVTTTVGWSYDAGDNSVDFQEGYIPEGGTTVEIEYDLLPDDCTR